MKKSQSPDGQLHVKFTMGIEYVPKLKVVTAVARGGVDIGKDQVLGDVCEVWRR